MQHRILYSSLHAAHLTACCALTVDDVVAASYATASARMLIASYNRKLIVACRYQTLWTDANCSDAVKDAYILQSVLPDGFVLSSYYALSRKLLSLASNKKNKTKNEEGHRRCIRGLQSEEAYEPTEDPRKLDTTQLLTRLLGERGGA